jgi:hypothetical protein
MTPTARYPTPAINKIKQQSHFHLEPRIPRSIRSPCGGVWGGGRGTLTYSDPNTSRLIASRFFFKAPSLSRAVYFLPQATPILPDSCQGQSQNHSAPPAPLYWHWAVYPTTLLSQQGPPTGKRGSAIGRSAAFSDPRRSRVVVWCPPPPHTHTHPHTHTPTHRCETPMGPDLAYETPKKYRYGHTV